MKIARSLLLLGAACLVTSSPTAAPAWGWQGHEYVGALAWQLLNPNARNHVAKLLGHDVSLSLATVWPDCAKDALGPPDYRLNQHMLPQVCNTFAAPEHKLMYDYTRRNWSNCDYAHKPTQCHRSFHFADVNVHEHQDYAASYFGAEPYDVVQAIKALTIVLKCKNGESCDTSPFPGKIDSKREALILLAHFVGDVHQPLHVGAVYLDPTSSAETGDSGLETIGGNALQLSASENLHHKWDSVSQTAPSPQAVAQACLLSPLPNPTPEPPEKWASESVAAAVAAYSNMSFTRQSPTKNAWDVELADPAKYSSDARQVQGQRLIQGGARLAAVLNSIWPAKKKAAACR